MSDGQEANPIKRGAWFARKLIAEPPADPPPNVPELSEDTSHLSLRARLEQHRNQKGCIKCHQGIDPWGIPFEEISADGLYSKKSQPEDIRTTLPDGAIVTGVKELKLHLSTKRMDQVAFSFLKHLALYATGRNLSYNEIEFLRESAVEFQDTNYRARDLVEFVVLSPIFLQK